MNNYNKVILIGRLTQNPARRYTSSGMAYAIFGLAINNQYMNKKGVLCDDATFIDVIAWDKLAEQAVRHLSKGSLVHLDGRLQFRTWEDTNGRGKRSKHSIVAENIQFLGPRDPIISDPAIEKSLAGLPAIAPLAKTEAKPEVAYATINMPPPTKVTFTTEPDSLPSDDLYDEEERQAEQERERQEEKETAEWEDRQDEADQRAEEHEDFIRERFETHAADLVDTERNLEDGWPHNDNDDERD